ncbi:MAG: hypothetical protein IJ204_08440 [Paludibacteraceae bacterium]|nr:hypothetical protein [Paludibacteraceae bacterium]
MPQEQETSRFIPQPPYGPPRRNVPPPPNAAAPGAPMPGMPQDPMMPPPQRRRALSWKERVMGRYGMGMHTTLQRGELTMPDWLVGKPMLAFFVAFIVCSAAFGHAMPWRLALMSGLSLLLFFYGVREMAANWQRANERVFVKNLLIAGLLLRFVWLLYSYFVFNPEVYGKLDGFGDDNGWYLDFAQGIARWLKGDIQGSFSLLMKSYAAAIDDTGYPFLLAVEYLLTFESSDVFFPLLVKSIMNAYCAISIYHIAKRHFGVGTARMAALFVMLNPCMLFWCTCMLKEAEMVFLCCLSIDMIDSTLSAGKKLTFSGLLPGVIVGSLLFFFRTALALVLFLAVFAHIVFASHRVMSNGKKIIAGILVGATLFLGLGDRMRSQSEKLLETVQSGQQKVNMEWRAERKGGNSFAKYAGAAVFAPLIFTIPFPTINEANEDQQMLMEQSGGYFIKNILSFFVILVMILFLASGEWRKHVFIIAYTVGYLMVLVLSEFAQSGRFHMPIMPMLMLFAAYGVQIAKGNKRLQMGFNVVLLLEILVCLAWNWFKLKGRGMI